MSTPVRPRTPSAQTPTPSTPQTGTWRHPKFDEIARRQSASSFSEKNIKKIFYNIAGLLTFWLLEIWLMNYFPSAYVTAEPLQPYSAYAYHLVRLLLVYNIGVALLPLFKPKDDLSDIPLTPGQRKLLGLPPSSAPPTPGSSYATPPRYLRTSTPLSGSSSDRGSYTNSPLSARGSPVSGNLQGSPFSPGASPLLQKAIGGGFNGARRASYGSPSPLGPGASRINITEISGTPSPSTAKGASVGLNNKWLYDKGKRNSGSGRLFT